MLNQAIRPWATPAKYLAETRPEVPILFSAPALLQERARRFIAGFPGLVTYAVKANPDEAVIRNLIAAGITAFDVASPFEITLMRRLGGDVALHYHNPVKSKSEIAVAHAAGVKTYALDSFAELDRIRSIVPPEGAEISVRFKLSIKGGHYDFGSKFGEPEETAPGLLKAVAAAGYIPSLTFHPGTQCTDPEAYVQYIEAAHRIATRAGIRIARLNVGGGFPACRGDVVPELSVFFAAIRRAAEVFGEDRPELVCEPGRGMVAPSFALAVQVKAIRDTGDVFLNDGIYGGLSEFPYLTVNTDYQVIAPDGSRRDAAMRQHTVYGPTCDSADVLPAQLALPETMAEGDYILFRGMGAYVLGLNTMFNGYGAITQVSVLHLYG
jgi:ornithine decarboxylase